MLSGTGQCPNDPTMPATVCLCVLCGLPASGKSSLVQAASAQISKQGWGTFIISYDHLIAEEAFDFSSGDSLSKGQTRWKQHRQAVLTCLESFLQDPQAPSPCRTEGNVWECFSQAVEQQQILPALRRSSSQPPRIAVLLDDNFYYQSMRYEVYQLARKYSTGFCQLYLHCPLEVCLSRNQDRGQPVPDEIIVEMSKRIEPPNAQKNQWEQSSLTLISTDITDTDIQKLLQLMSSALENPLSPFQDDSEQRAADREHCASSVVHQADQACRRLVSQAMLTARESKASSEVLRVLAKDLSEQKGHFLQELRRHVLHELPVSEGETVDVERVVSRALTVFQQQRDDVLERHGIGTGATTA
ncbi:LOW QUALITY PROTEIN: L-seryl-tRNA(Sec) kinase-like [Colossoma macropomum]|uniref:LOW QUALITY PROTEIN: L-seryl-tRNA(Sec) kinase-like n=1 Tax=Colossoma macropomum TaxID=42526 RepID=UPI001865559C|nr:LOW QUALITY PROTEIN: L-seryl-tRNA(Sec) kinase-like [Colossoma macropomum]